MPHVSLIHPLDIANPARAIAAQVTVFTTKDSTGVGTILGSAVFNLVMIVCVSPSARKVSRTRTIQISHIVLQL